MGWTGGLEELGFDEGLLSDNEVGCRDVTGIGRTLVTELGFRDGSLEFLVKFVKIDHKVFGTGGYEVTFGMDCKVRMISLISEEWRNSHSSTQSVCKQILQEEVRCTS